MNLFAVAPNYDHNRRTASFTCCINDRANERITAKWEQLLWLPEPRRSTRSENYCACHPEQNHAESKDPAVSPSRARSVTSSRHPAPREAIVLPSDQINIRAPGRG
jgi:hypothetical protein